MKRYLTSLCALSFLFICAYSHAPSPPIPIWTKALASWYGDPFHGRTTANGEIYDKHLFTAASRTLPFNAQYTLRYRSNYATVRINDRGPYCCVDSTNGLRDIDVSEAVARKLGLLRTGVDWIEIMRP